MYCGLAERKTSNGSPCRICCASWFEPANEARALRRRSAAAPPSATLRRGRPPGLPSRARGATGAATTAAATTTAASSRAVSAPHRSTITLVDLTTPAALIPAASPSSSADSRVTIATTRAGSVTSISTRASSPSTSTERTTPRKRLRAESPSVAVARRAGARSRRPARHAGWRRLARRGSFRSRSQRRSVSRQIPSARAASRGGQEFPRHCLWYYQRQASLAVKPAGAPPAITETHLNSLMSLHVIC